MSNKPLQIGQEQSNFRVGSVAPVYKEEQVVNKTSPLLTFLDKVGEPMKKVLKNSMDSAEVEGALNAARTTGELEDNDPELKKYNWFLRDSFKVGHNSAAATNLLVKYNASLDELNKKAVVEEWSEEQYDEARRKLNSEHAGVLTDRVSKIPYEKGKQIAEAYRVNGIAADASYMKLRTEYQVKKDKEGVIASTNQSADMFEKYMATGDVNAAHGMVVNGIKAIQASQFMSPEEKLKEAKNFFVNMAKNTDDPQVVDMLQQIAEEAYGTQGNDIATSLFTEFKRAGKQNTAKALTSLDDRIFMMRNLSTEDRIKVQRGIEKEIIDLHHLGILTPEQASSRFTAMREMSVKADAKADSVNALGNGVPMSAVVNSPAWKGNYKKFIEDTFGTDIVTLAKLNSDAEVAGDWEARSAIWSMISSKVNMHMDNILSAKFGAKGDARDIPIPKEAEQVLQYFMTGLQNASGEAERQDILRHLPKDKQFAMMLSMSQSPLNPQAAIFDVFKDVKEQVAKGNYDTSMYAIPKQYSKTDLTPWYRSGYSEEEANTAAMAMKSEYWRAEVLAQPWLSRNPDALNAEVERKMEAGTLQINVKANNLLNRDVDFFLPAGHDLHSIYGEKIGASRDVFLESLSDTAKVIAEQAGGDIKMQVRFAGGRDLGSIAVTAINTNGIAQTWYVSKQDIVARTSKKYTDRQALYSKKYDAQVGTAPVILNDVAGGRRILAENVGGNSIGVNAHYGNRAASIIMGMEQYYSKPVKMSNGQWIYGFSKISPTEPSAVDQKKEIAEKRTAIYRTNMTKAKGLTEKYPMWDAERAVPILSVVQSVFGDEMAEELAAAMKEATDNPKANTTVGHYQGASQPDLVRSVLSKDIRWNPDRSAKKKMQDKKINPLPENTLRFLNEAITEWDAGRMFIKRY